MKIREVLYRLFNLQIILLLFSELSLAYDWPMGSGIEQEKITSTFMEYRTTNGLHFHSGVDMIEWNGDPAVYNIQDDAYIWEISGSTYNDEYIRAGDFRYFHIDVWSGYQVGETIPINAWIGDIHQTGGPPHLHFQEGSPGYWVNPLQFPGLDPYSDNDDPVLNGISLQTDGTNPQPVTATNVQGNIDIVVDCYDRTYNYNPTNPLAQPGVFSMGYWIEDENNRLCSFIGPENNFVSNYYEFVLLTNNSNPGFSLIWHSDNHLFGTNKLAYLSTGTPSNGYFKSDLIRNGNFQICVEVADIAGTSQNFTNDCYNIVINNPAQVRSNDIQNTTEDWYGENLVTGHYDPIYNRNVLRVINSNLGFPAWCRVRIQSNVWLIFEFGSTHWQHPDAEVIFEPGAEIIYRTGATATLASSNIEFGGAGSCMTIQGSVNIADNVDIMVDNQGLILVDGGELKLGNNSKLIFDATSNKFIVRPASTIKLGDGAEVILKSGLDARGTAANPITFTSLYPKPAYSQYWTWLKLDGSQDQDPSPQRIINHAVIKYAESGIHATQVPNLTLKNSTLQSCWIENLYLNNSYAYIDSCQINEAGVYRVRWDGKNGSGVRVHSGVYVYTLRAGSFSQRKKMVLMR